MGLHVFDYIVLVLYFIVLLFIGFNESRKIKHSGDFFMPRKFGKIMMMMFSFGTGTHSDQAVGVASKSFTNGLSGIWYQWLYLPVTPFYWLIAATMRRFRAITMADVLQSRFGYSVAMLFSAVGMWHLIVTIGLMLKSSGEVLASSVGNVLPVNTAIIIMTVMFVIYGVTGGLSAAIIIDFIQGIFIIVFSFLLLPFVLHSIGGMEALHTKLLDPAMMSLVTPKDISLFYLLVIAFNGLVGVGGMPSIISAGGAGRTELDGRVGLTGGNLLKRLCTIPWCLTGVAGVVYFAGRDIHPDQVFGTLAREFLGGVMPGLLGVFIAGVMSAVMSGCSTFMITSSALFTENIYKKFVLNKNPGHYVLVGRIASIGVVIGGVTFAFWLPNVVKGLEIFWGVSTMIGIAFWLGFFWRRTTEIGAWTATISAMVAWFISTQDWFISFLSNLPVNQTMRLVVEKPHGLEMYLPWQMLFYLTAGILGGIIGSLLTKPLPDAKLDKFYELLRTPVQPGEKLTASCTLPDDAVVPPRKNLLPFKSLEVQVPSKVSVIGFLVCWVIVAALIWMVYLIANIGK